MRKAGIETTTAEQKAELAAAIRKARVALGLDAGGASALAFPFVADDFTVAQARHALIGAGADRAGANVFPFPPRPQHVAHIVQLAEETASAELLPTARAALNAAHRQRHHLAARTANLHRVYAALLMCCRLLDEAAYPWEAICPGDMLPPSLPAGGAA